jgi:hypothetical protein
MAGEPKDQKTAILGDVPPEVQAALNRGQQQQQPQKTVAFSAPASAPQPAGGGSQRTVMLDSPTGAQAPRAAAPAPVPDSMRQRPSGPLPPLPKKPSSAGRWIAGPIIALVMAAGTAALARVIFPAKPKEKPKVMGKLRLSTDPAGASMVIDGKAYPRFTPTTYEGEVGSTVHVVFKADGYKDKEVDLTIKEEEQPFATKLEKETPPEPEPPKPEPPKTEPPKTEPPKTEPVAKTEPKHSSSHSSKKTEKSAPVGKGTLSVYVRPWAIVFVDGARLRQTPVQNYELPAGKHNIELVNDPKGKKEKITVTIKAGESEELRRDWDK